MTGFVIGMFAGIVGFAYMVYGKKTQTLVPRLAGIALCIYPWFLDSVFWLSVVGILLLLSPFVIRDL